MPSLENYPADRPHYAVYWPFMRYDRFGQPVVVTNPNAIELRVRWNDVFKQIVDPKGNIISIDAQIVVDRDIPVGSVLWRGRLTDVVESGVGGIGLPTDYRAVIGFNGTSDLKGRDTFREVFASRQSDTQVKQE